MQGLLICRGKNENESHNIMLHFVLHTAESKRNTVRKMDNISERTIFEKKKKPRNFGKNPISRGFLIFFGWCGRQDLNLNNFRKK